jgi:hypothetical protein
VHRLREEEVMVITVITTTIAEETTEYIMAVGMIVTLITGALIIAAVLHQRRLSMWSQLP